MRDKMSRGRSAELRVTVVRGLNWFLLGRMSGGLPVTAIRQMEEAMFFPDVMAHVIERHWVSGLEILE